MKREIEYTALYDSVPLYHSDDIRVLELQPGQSSSRIDCFLRRTRLADNPLYEALSYTWGERDDANSIFVNDTEVPVTDNLYLALRSLRLRKGARTLWVDAVCINQASARERDHQVSMMSRIYKSANRTNVWLGQANKELRRWLVLSTVASGYRLTRDSGFRRLPSRSIMKSLFFSHLELMNDAIDKTFPRWLDRAWVVQEFALSQRVFLCFGHYEVEYTLDWSASALALIRKQRWSGFYDVETLLNYLERLRGGLELSPGGSMRGSNFRDLQALCGSKVATDPRDKIFAFLTLVSDEEASLNSPNYRKPTWQVFAEATYASLRTQKDYSILEFVYPRVPRRNRLADLPSWAVDFSYLLVPMAGWTAHFSAHQPTTPPVLDPTCRHLTVSGISFDEVESVMKLTTYSVHGLAFLLDIFGQRASEMAYMSSLESCTPSCAARIILKSVREEKWKRRHIFEEVRDDESSTSETDLLTPETEISHAMHIWAFDTFGIYERPREDLNRHVSDFLAIYDGPDGGYLKSITDTKNEFAVVRTANGVFGVVSSAVREGDRIFLTSVGSPPLVVRRRDDSLHRFLGTMLLHPDMQNTLPEDSKIELAKLETENYILA